MKEIIFSRQDAKTAKGFLGELCAFAREITAFMDGHIPMLNCDMLIGCS